MRQLIRVLWLALVLVVLAASLALAYAWRWLDTPLNLPEQGQHYLLEPGRALAHLGRDLEQQGVMGHARLWVLYARLQDRTRIQAGEYFLPAGTTPRQLLARLERGDVVFYQVTLVEGWTYAQALQALHREPVLEARLAGLSRAEQLQQLDLDIEHPEGWFFPDTYRYVRGDSDVDILRRAHGRMQSLLAQLWEARTEGLPYADPYQALIMASIVERETGAPWERADIAGVFVRRLNIGMRLQTDPTVIYGMGDSYQGRITRADLRRPTAYNTYTIRGLPPTPIALPGREALAAALNPAPGTSLYFVARGDGTHVFSDTLEEHNRAVNRYQRQRREDYRSTLSPGAAAPGAEATAD